MTDGRGSVFVRKVSIAVLMVVVVPLAILALIEGSASAWLLAADIRAIKSDSNFRRAQYDSVVGWIGTPDLHVPDRFSPGIALTNNHDGMRIFHPVTPALPPGRHRLICSGDSFTAGSGVGDADTFCAQLESVLPNTETLNMAQPGFGIDQMYLWYKRDAVRWPHQVHLFAFIWNDFERMTLTTFTGYSKPVLRLDGNTLVPGNTPPPRWTGSSKGSYVLRLMPRLRLMQLMQRSQDNSDSAKMSRVDQQIWDVAEAVFRDVDRLNRERGSQAVLVYLPTDADLLPGAYDTRRARLAAFASKAGIPLVDLTPEMRAVPRDSSQWFFITNNELTVDGASGHYTRSGHHWVAATIAQHLAQLPVIRASLGLAVPGAAR